MNLSNKQIDQGHRAYGDEVGRWFHERHGGTLLIGVDRPGEVFGLEKDMKTLGSKQNRTASSFG